MIVEPESLVADITVDADVAAIGRIGAVSSILEVICRITGMRFAAIARVTKDHWTACAIRDEIQFGLKVGGELPVKTTICDEIRQSGHAVIIDKVSEDPQFRDHRTPRMYGFQSYISVPIVRTNGEFFGTLCALDPEPVRLSDSKVAMSFELFAQLIARELDSEEYLEESRKALLDEKQTSELREQFIAVLGHDMRNPLFSVSAGAHALLKMPLPAQAITVAERIKRSGDRMARLVDNLLDFARGRLGSGIPIIKQTADTLQQTLAHVVAELSVAHPGRRVELQLDIAKPVSCDPSRIGQLFSNVLGNALTHGDSDEPVHVRALCDGATFSLAVTNRGVPIPQETIARLFQPFTRFGDDSKGEGLGLGLYIASKIAEAHEGTLDVKSDQDGTTFTLSMRAS